MMSMLPKFSVAIASTAFCFAAIETCVAVTDMRQAPAPDATEIITYDFAVNVTEGVLAGNTFIGAFSYDASTITGVGMEEVGVADGLTVDMNFLGKDYSEVDDIDYPAYPKLVFEDGEITRLDFWIEPGDRVLWWDLSGWEVVLSPRQPVEE